MKIEVTNEMVSRFIRNVNRATGKRYKFDTESTQNIVKPMLETVPIDNAILEMCNIASTGENDLVKICFGIQANYLTAGQDEIIAEAVKEAIDTKQQDMARKAAELDMQADMAMNVLGKALIDMMSGVDSGVIENRAIENVCAQADKYIAEKYGPIQRKISVEINGAQRQLEGTLHEKFDDVLKFVTANEPVFLTGPAGAGKNFMCKQVAEALGLKFYFTNAVTQEYKLTGFTDANGNYQATQFYEAFKNGGLFMLDEMDASIPEVLIILNAAIANRYFDFPAPIGYVEAHPNFRVVAAGNTSGEGATFSYVGRNQLDAASLDRFAMVDITYDKRIEEACALGNVELLSFCRAFRDAINEAGINTVVSYRAISRMAKLYGQMPLADLLHYCLTKSLNNDDMTTIKKNLQSYGEFTTAFNTLVKE